MDNFGRNWFAFTFPPPLYLLSSNFNFGFFSPRRTREKFVLLVLFNKNIYREKIPLQMKFQRRIALYTPPEGAMKFNENWRELWNFPNFPVPARLKISNENGKRL